MNELKIIESITNNIKNYGFFSIGDFLDGETGIVVGQLGNYVGIAERFFSKYATINVYDERTKNLSVEIDSYQMSYDEMNEDTLSDILFLCEQWEAECIKTQKRIN
jgi:hypothetical protein